MATREGMLRWLKKVPASSYYEILRVPRDATEAQIKANFHDFALQCHPDRFAGEAPDVVAVASEAFKRGVEAYRVLLRAPLRERYDRVLAQGRLRLDDKSIESAPPPPTGKTLAEVAKTAKGREHAAKADRLLTIGKLEEARVALVTALQNEPHNHELEDRLKLLYEAMALEPL